MIFSVAGTVLLVNGLASVGSVSFVMVQLEEEDCRNIA